VHHRRHLPSHHAPAPAGDDKPMFELLRHREIRNVLIASGLVSMAWDLHPLFERLLPLAAATFLLGLGLGAAQPNLMSLIHARSPTGRVGEALGLRATIMNGSHVVLPLVFGAAAVFWTMAALLGAGGAAAWRHVRAHP
jgi:hypothetical protein